MVLGQVHQRGVQLADRDVNFVNGTEVPEGREQKQGNYHMKNAKELRKVRKYHKEKDIS